MEHFFFYAGLAFMVVHEMDAVRFREWKMLPLLSKLNDKNAYMIFTGLHVPVYFLIFWVLFLDKGNSAFIIIGLDAFFIFHFFLHILVGRKKDDRLINYFSWILITGIGISGALDLMLKFS